MSIERKWYTHIPIIDKEVQRRQVLRRGHTEQVWLELIDEGAMGAHLSLRRVLKVLDQNTIQYSPLKREIDWAKNDPNWVRFQSYRAGDIRQPKILIREEINNYFRPDVGGSAEFLTSGGGRSIEIIWRPD